MAALDLLKLTDRYERKARLLPALLSALVLLPGATALGLDVWGWLASLSAGVGVSAVCAVGLAYAASAAGRQYERKLWPNWPYDSPTNQWLHPEDTSCSYQQKQLWYEAINCLTGLDIASASQKDDDELKRVINDAVRTLRSLLRASKNEGLLSTSNEDYGFARNFAGLRLIWLPAAVVSAAVAWTAYGMTGHGLVWGITASLVTLLCLVLLRILPDYVRQRADRYAESFFGTMVLHYHATRGIQQ